MKSGLNYSVRIKDSAAKELARVPQQAKSRLVHAIDGLHKQPLAGSALKGGLRGLRRLRVGNYRVIYELLDDELIVLVVRIAHRRDAYQRE